MRRLLSAVLVLATCAVAAAQSDDADALLARARHVAEDDPQSAAALLESLARKPGVSAGQRVRGTRLAFDLLPLADGDRVAAALVLATLRENRSQPEAWQLAFRVRDRVMDGLDLANGAPFLRAMIELYPDQLRFQYYLADLYLDAGRPQDAEARCLEILRQSPEDTRARRLQAYICELDGRTDEALALYAEIHRISGELEPLLYRVRMLIEPVRDYAAAEKALGEAFAAVERAPAGRSRNAVRAELENETTRLADERRRRRELLDVAARQDRLAALILAGWGVLLGGGLAFLRRRRLV